MWVVIIGVLSVGLALLVLIGLWVVAKELIVKSFFNRSDAARDAGRRCVMTR